MHCCVCGYYCCHCCGYCYFLLVLLIIFVILFNIITTTFKLKRSSFEMIAHRPETTVFCLEMISVKDGYSFSNSHFFYVNGTTKTIPSAIFASRWTFEVPQSHPCWKSCGSSGQLHPHSVATAHQAAHLCLESSVLLLSCSGDKRARVFVVLHVRKQQQNRGQQLIRHAAIWKKEKKTQRAAELQKKRGRKQQQGKTCWSLTSQPYFRKTIFKGN